MQTVSLFSSQGGTTHVTQGGPEAENTSSTVLVMVELQAPSTAV